MGIASILSSVTLKIVDTLQSCFLKTEVSNGQINKNTGKKNKFIRIQLFVFAQQAILIIKSDQRATSRQIPH